MSYRIRLKFAKWILTVVALLLAFAGANSFAMFKIYDDAHLYESDNQTILLSDLVFLNTGMWWLLLLPPILVLLWRRTKQERFALRVAAYLTALPMLKPIAITMFARIYKLESELIIETGLPLNIVQAGVLTLVIMAAALSLSPGKTVDRAVN